MITPSWKMYWLPNKIRITIYKTPERRSFRGFVMVEINKKVLRVLLESYHIVFD